jgi:hypothetical protein
MPLEGSARRKEESEWFNDGGCHPNGPLARNLVPRIKSSQMATIQPTIDSVDMCEQSWPPSVMPEQSGRRKEELEVFNDDGC